jgi:peptide alpha-N-acetyltransferase
MGKPGDAVMEVEKARKLDEADRYLNTKAVKYYLRNNNMEEADRKSKLFSPTTDDRPNYTMMDMQWIWYAIEEGDAYFRLGDIITAMKRWLLVDKHFLDMEEDQFDFHTYCLRKCTMRTYVDLLRFGKRSRGHIFYLKAAERVVKGYIHVFDALKQGQDLHKSVILPKEKEVVEKRAVEKTKKAEKKTDKKHKNDKHTKDKNEQDDEEEEGEEETEEDLKAREWTMHVDLKDPLTAVLPIMKSFVRFSPNGVLAHTLAAEIYIRREKPLLAIKNLISGFAFDPNNEQLQRLSKQTLDYVEKQEISASIKAAVDMLRSQLS